LPEGDFSLLSQLPALYQHCKVTEDADMDLVDFITDHLINIDCIFDKHLPGDDQKPHQPFLFQHLQHLTIYLPAFLQLSLRLPYQQPGIRTSLRNDNTYADYVSYIFHPPDHFSK
jgi:hypothetical protein